MRLILDIALVLTVAAISIAWVVGFLVAAPFIVSYNVYQFIFDRDNCCWSKK